MTDRDWNTVILIAALCFLGFVLGFATGATFDRGCIAIKEAPFGCLEWWLSRYQTLLAMAGAFLVAWFAAQPLWKQLKLSSVQTTTNLHQVYSAREKVLAARAKSELARLEKLSTDLSGGYKRVKDDGGLSHWVWDMEQVVDSIKDRLDRRQADNIDGDETIIARQELIGEITRLRECMSDFNASVYADDPEYESTPEAEANVAAAEDRASKELPDRIEDVSLAITGLRKAFATDLQEIRLKRQSIDQVLVNADVP